MESKNKLPPVETKPLTIAVADIDANSLNPRGWFPPESLRELGENMLAVGQLDRIRVRPHPATPGRYQLIDGERRWQAAQAVGMPSLKAEVGAFADSHMLQIAFATGTQTQKLSAIEEAMGLAAAMKELGIGLDRVAAYAGMSKSHASGRLDLLRLPPAARKAVMEGRLPATTASLIAAIPCEKQMAECAEKVMHPDAMEGPMSYRATAALIRGKYSRSLQRAPFDVADAALVPAAGACTACPWQAGNNPEVYGQYDNPRTCMRPACFEEKAAAARARVAAEDSGDAGAKRALSAEENARVFPEGQAGPSYDSGYVAYHRPPPADLLKPEVENAPKFSEASPGVTVYIGCDQAGHVCELVKLDEAITATIEPDIFAPWVFSRYGLKDNEAMKEATADKAQAEPKSVRSTEQRSKAEKAKADRQRAKRDRATSEWLGKISDALGPKELESYTLHALLYEHELRTLSADDLAFVVRAVSDEVVEKKDSARDVLGKVAAGMKAADLAALVVVMRLAPAARAAGLEAAWVCDWHKAFLGDEAEEKGAA